LAEALALYQKNLGALLLTCAILIGPVALLKSAAVALILAPTAVAQLSANNMHALSERTAADIRREALEAQRDPKRWQENARDRQREQQKEMEDLSKAWATTGTTVVSGLVAVLLGLLAVIVGIALMYGIAVPLTTGALTILVADRATGGALGPMEAYGLLFRRFGKLMSAVIPAFLFVLLGFCFFVIPGLVLGFLFVFATPVVLLENVGGIEALKRSVDLVKANASQVFVVCLVFALLRFFSSITAHIFIPSSAFFLGSLVQDVILLFLMPVPIIGTVLLYLDIRRQTGNLDDRSLRSGIDGLRTA
jgi:hypothetical protein